MKQKQILFSSIEFSEIGGDSLIFHKYIYDKDDKTLSHYVDLKLDKIYKTEKEVRDVINKLMN